MDSSSAGELRTRLHRALGGRFEVGELLGTGGFAAVFRASDPLLKRDVVVKVLAPAVALGPGAADQLLAEARLIAGIEHPHIVPLYEAGEADGLVYLAMRYFPDGTLTRHLAQSAPVQPAEVARIGIQVADALAAAHQRGVVHLDIKPDNILVDGAGNLAVSDFGIAQLIASSRPRDLDSISGSPAYMSPEQVAGDAVDGRADLYALGTVLYEAATGTRPARGSTAHQVLASQVSHPAAPIGSVRPDFPAELGQVIMRALEKDPAKRWPGAADMGQALRAASSREKLLSPANARRRARRRWYARGGILAAGLLIGFSFLGWWAVKILKLFTSGVPPAIDASAPNIPEAMLDSLRAHGVGDADPVRYVFAPSGRTLADAFVVTDSNLVVLRAWQAERYAFASDPQVNTNLNEKGGSVVILRKGSASSDTIFTGMTGVEQQVLILGLRRATQERDTAPQ